MEFLDKKTIKLDKVLNEVDLFTLKSAKILGRHTRYVIVSGYVAILFGRTRTTEDVDVILPRIHFEKFNGLYEDFVSSGFWCINTEGAHKAFEQISHDEPIRFAEKGIFAPNLEAKFAKSELDRQQLGENLKVLVGGGELHISEIEIEVPYKRFMLKSKKDLDDALHLEKLFEGHIDKKKLELYTKKFNEGV